jgi:ABC-2 type transport system ATP-binding protein
VTVRFTVDHPDAAKQLIEENNKFDVLKSTASELEIILDKEQIPEVVQLFVQHQINIYGIITLTKSLEDKFLEVTGGKGIV